MASKAFKFNPKSDEELKKPPKHLRYPDMKVPKNLGKPKPKQIEIRSPFGYITNVTEKEAEPLLRLGWELI